MEPTEEVHSLPGLHGVPGGRDHRSGRHDRRGCEHRSAVACRVERTRAAGEERRVALRSEDSMPYACNGSVRIHYQVEGRGPALVLQHGFTESLVDWYEAGYVDALKPDYRLVLIDARGHGASDKPHDPDAYLLGERVADVVAARRPGAARNAGAQPACDPHFLVRRGSIASGEIELEASDRRNHPHRPAGGAAKPTVVPEVENLIYASRPSRRTTPG